jgi:site-specific DNA recombinase
VTTNAAAAASWTPPTPQPRTGREYLRVSFDRSGRERSPDEQHADNDRACTPRGITLGAPYREQGSASASRYATKVRDDFERLIGDLEADRFGADVLVLWESSRGSRKVGEWVTLIDLCEKRGVMIFVVTHEREYNPANPRDRRSLLEDAVDSEYESSKVSARARRASAANAEAGKPHGATPYGYVRRYDEHTRRLIAQEPHPDEAPIVRELFARLKAGHSLKGLERDFAARGIRNDSGRPFTAQHLRALALNATYAGIRLHQTVGERASRSKVRGLPPGVKQVQGTWEPLVSKADFLAVHAILTDPKRVTSRPGRVKHLLTMIAQCDVCDGVLGVTLRVRETGEYQCRRGHVRVRKEELDKIVEGTILKYLAHPEIHDDLTAGDGQSDGELDKVRDDLASARAELSNLRAEVGAGRLSVASLVAAEPAMLARVEALESRENDLITPAALRGLITPGGDVAKRWADMPIEARREVARYLLTPEHLGVLRVFPRPPGRRNVHVPTSERHHFVRHSPAS